MAHHVLTFAIATLIASSAFAHPAVSVAIDSRGNVFYSDLEQVWRIAPDGRKTIAVPNVHTHELSIDAADNLYGEHLWYEGEKTNQWGHRVWKRSPDGTIVNVIPPARGFRTSYTFQRDRAGNMYWIEGSKVRRRLPNGGIETVAQGKFRDPRWMIATRDGTVYFIDVRDLVRVSGGTITTLARNLSEPDVVRAPFGGRHSLMGLWTDARGNVYVADAAGGEVKRVDGRGRVSVIAESSWPWSPTGGAFAPNGDLWLLECSITNRVRVRRITSGGRETVY